MTLDSQTHTHTSVKVKRQLFYLWQHVYTHNAVFSFSAQDTDTPGWLMAAALFSCSALTVQKEKHPVNQCGRAHLFQPIPGACPCSSLCHPSSATGQQTTPPPQLDSTCGRTLNFCGLSCGLMWAWGDFLCGQAVISRAADLCGFTQLTLTDVSRCFMSHLC